MKCECIFVSRCVRTEGRQGSRKHVIVKKSRSTSAENKKILIAEGIADWAMGEALALGSLLRDRIHVRFTGEDVERGTMAHRHHVYHHQGVDGATYRVLDTLYPDQARYSLHNSSLSEFGVLGFEVGYSYTHPYLLSIWEAQYGDFADTAQPMFDTFIANGESKWVCQSGLVVQLPHGIDGAGPEHSSARIERYLQQADDDEDVLPDLDDPACARNIILSAQPYSITEMSKEFKFGRQSIEDGLASAQPAEDSSYGIVRKVEKIISKTVKIVFDAVNQLKNCNWIVANVTSTANYFHLVRRQIALPFRKPLILMTPKVGLKHPFYRSPFKDFLTGTTFQRRSTGNYWQRLPEIACQQYHQAAKDVVISPKILQCEVKCFK
ncbi:2-oxoglutarate dehydrogenase, mitochondrial [Eumeta japonica]|uniref:2-oxoglutarate dehydrogenase, mitochondrial n=1 Tax=Eumeta variegata TaxID=151549 RepID=A0A4C1VYY3_EUMVA|nr:2-oxoglutarate dehydrogenase, mitochondrial [Eumeta japonica]